MDKLLYIAMTGAKETLRAQAANNHNLANASTTGFRADMSAFQSREVTGTGYASLRYRGATAARPTPAPATCASIRTASS
jgi:flagellar basal-body rod protein FlgF